MTSFNKYLNLIQNMGWRYITFRVSYLLKVKLGLLKKRFPINPQPIVLPDLKLWRNNKNINFFFRSKEEMKRVSDPATRKSLEETITRMKRGEYQFFSSTWYNLGNNYDWITNPITDYKYDISKHWSEINDFSPEAGDIKYVWEKARFSFLYTIIRYDQHSGKDQSEWVFSEIEDFIDKNPINQGPNYKCSQEISLRILNWTYALNYYKSSPNLTDELFNKILNSIYWQYHHVYHNINFSRIAVRNNHAITETLTLYLIGLLYPFFPNAVKWKAKGKQWFEEEIAYQVYEDGSFLQFSHNYHRVAIQLLTWAIILSERNDEKFNETVYERALKSLNFLRAQQDENTGWLPNYGMNDGALFFPLNDNHYRDFRSQLQTLAKAIGMNLYDEEYEDLVWFGLDEKKKEVKIAEPPNELINFPIGGFYGFRDNALTTIRCGSYKDRPAQADSLNIDIWVNGINFIRDPGTFKYNTEEKYKKFYFGTSGHNTLSIGDYDQMQKGSRFIWYNWTRAFDQKIEEKDETFEFEGKISGFNEIAKSIIHHRKVIKYKNQLRWKIIDNVNYNGDIPKVLRWNLHPAYQSKVAIECINQEGLPIKMEKRPGWYSEKYGIKEKVEQFCFITNAQEIETNININS